jgi:hypothetical protein
MIKQLCTFFIFFASLQTFANESPIAFCNYLYSNKNYAELKTYCETLISSDVNLFNPQTTDSLKLFWVRAKLSLDITDTSIQLVKINSLEKQLSTVKIYQLLYVNDIQKATEMIGQLDLKKNDSLLYLITQSFLLLRNQQFAVCENTLLANKSKISNYKDEILINKLVEIIEYTKKIKRKSAIKSAIISCFIPGYGKKYVGLNGEAVGTLLTNGILGVVFAENIWRKGFKSPYTIGAGLLFSTFYFSNIVGSYYAAKRTNLQQERIVNEKICTALDFWVNYNFEL